MAVLAQQTQAETLKLFAAGSLRAAMTDIAHAYEKAHSGRTVEATFGSSGLLRQRIEAGEVAHVYASANMKHPTTLATAGKSSTPAVMFARNQLCAIAQKDVDVTTATLLDRMLEPNLVVGTSTPKADPSGDYAFELFAKADSVKAGARAALETKAQKLTGGANTQKAPKGRNQYGWVMSEGRADIFLTYCTNAILATNDFPPLQIVEIPVPLSVGADYGLIVLKSAPDSATQLAKFITEPAAQDILRSYGFGSADAP